MFFSLNVRIPAMRCTSLDLKLKMEQNYWNFRMHRQEKLKFTEILYQQEK